MSLHPLAIDARGAMSSTNLHAGVVVPRRLMRRSPDGAYVVVAGAGLGLRDGRGAAAQFTGIDGMAIAPDGSLLVSDGTSIRRVTADGETSTVAMALTEPSWGEDLMGLTVRDNGDIFVADYSGARVLWLRDAQPVESVLESGWPWAPTGVAFRGDDL